MTNATDLCNDGDREVPYDVPIGSFWHENSADYGFQAFWKVVGGPFKDKQCPYDDLQMKMKIEMIMSIMDENYDPHDTPPGCVQMFPLRHIQYAVRWQPIAEEDIALILLRHYDDHPGLSA